MTHFVVFMLRRPKADAPPYRPETMVPHQGITYETIGVAIYMVEVPRRGELVVHEGQPYRVEDVTWNLNKEADEEQMLVYGGSVVPLHGIKSVSIQVDCRAVM